MNDNPLDLDEEHRLAALYELKILDTPPEERFDRIIRLTAKYFSTPIAYIAFIDRERQWLKSSQGLSVKQTPRNISFCHHTIQQNTPLIVTDATQDTRFCNSPLVLDTPHMRFYAGIPLATIQGFNVGTLCVSDQIPRDLDADQIQLLKDLATLAEDQLTLLDISKLEKMIREKNEELALRNNFIRKAFSSFMSDEIVSKLLESTQKLTVGGEERKITVLFSDLRNFTPLAETYPADKIVSMLNNYYAHMVDVIEKYNGTIDSFIGDAIMVLFGAPYSGEDDAKRAIACALDMQEEMTRVNSINKTNNLPALQMGIGVNTGYAIVGTIGSEKRMQYSAIGSSVNLASRIQDLTLGGQILISAATYQEVAGKIDLHGHLRVKVKGIDSPITIYDVMGLKE
ncbi:adenylate/guanylate cyclase domain-containing protein [Legionella septentrionalis]|uniref:adenylate/guanylate cyclase domain-containing protein n=1 Tax=Legionella septentrionalis TaxID=2498109 RepID=UPI000F8D15F5|nr:adenylate/guanylate cyclase domain-containing protein [Legionella septentrionalis]RUQ95614.1 GAF domain-containing protein [Legionella septentrionalis]RUR10443.1 GAF domain-containing protein [Legionella septentrionalis]RUR16063.1 GAF domain-containing protein [Legionella septentrionalis]